MRVFRTNSGWRLWVVLAAICLCLTGDIRGQDAAAPPWHELLKNEFVVVGQYVSHKNGVMSLKVLDVLRGKGCKPGDLLPVKLSQRIGLKMHFIENGQFVEKIAVANDDKMKWPKLVFIEEQGGQLQESVISHAARLPHTFFFAREGQVILDRPDQVQPARPGGWRQALEGKPVDLSFQLLYAPDSELSRKAIAELFKTRDRDAIAGLIEEMLAGLSLPRLFQARELAKRVLLSLGDKNGDVYDPVRKALKPNTNPFDQCELAQMLPRLDRKRALADLKELHNQGQQRSGVSVAAVGGALADLDSEEGLELMFDGMLDRGDIYAYGSLQRMMFERHSADMVERARLQELAAPRLKKLLKNRALPDKIHSSAMFWANFCFLVEEPPNGALVWQMNIGHGMNIASRLPRRDGFPKWEHVETMARDDLEPILKADLVEGRKLLKVLLANTPKPGPNGPFDLLLLQGLAYRYGDADMVKKFKKPADPIVRLHNDMNKAIARGVPLSDFVPAFEDTLKLSPEYWARLHALFPEHADVYFREMEGLIVSEDRARREFAIRQLEEKFFWDFDLDADEFPFACKRKLEAVKPLLARLSRCSDLLEMRGILLRHFGIKLDGPPGRAWLPAIEAAALRWNAVIHLNAMCVLAMIEEDVDLMNLARNAPSVREKALQGHLKQRRARRDNPVRTPEQLESLWKDLDNAKQATSYAAMQALLEGRESAVAWLGKRLKQPNREPIRDARAIQVLEYMPSQDARALLAELAAGPEGLSLTHEARSAQRRLLRFWQW